MHDGGDRRMTQAADIVMKKLNVKLLEAAS